MYTYAQVYIDICNVPAQMYVYIRLCYIYIHMSRSIICAHACAIVMYVHVSGCTAVYSSCGAGMFLYLYVLRLRV